MTTQLRLILLALSLALLAGIWWWGGRKSMQAPGKSELREPSIGDPRRETLIETALDRDAMPLATEPIVPAPNWGVPPLEPLSIRTGEYDRVPVLDGKMMIQADPLPAAKPDGLTPRVANAAEQQKIVSIRVCAAGETRWPGAALLSVLESHGLAYGRYQVFHRKHIDGRSVFCAASLVEPGSFDAVQMPTQEFRGVTLFAVLPGPIDALQTMDELLTAARGLAHDLSGVVQDAKGVALSAQRAAALRDDVAHFQASLRGSQPGC